MVMNIRNKLILGFSAVIVTFVALSVFNYNAQTESMKRAKWVAHTVEVLDQSNMLLLGLVNMETGYRGYMLTGVESFLEPYNNGMKAYKQALDQLKTLTSDNPAQVGRWTEISKEQDLWQANWITPGMSLRQQANKGTLTIQKVLDYETSAGGKQYMDKIRSVLGEAQKIESELMTRRQKENQTAAAFGFAVILWGTLFGVLVGILTAFFLAKHLSSRIGRIVTAANQIAQKDLVALNTTAQALMQGDTSKKFTIETSQLTIDSTDEIGQVAKSFNLIIANLTDSGKAIAGISDTLRELISETSNLSKAAVEGILTARGDHSKFKGAYRDMVEGINKTLDSVIGPLNVAAKYVEDISKGVIPPTITDNYNGDFNKIKNNLNAVVKMMNDLLKETDILINAALTGNLGTRANAVLFVGGWNQLIAGINKTLDAVLEPINEASGVLEKVAARDMTARVTGDYKGDHAKIKNSLNSAVDNLDKALTQVSEATEQVTSASQQISSGSQSLAQGANEQASSLEEVSSSLEEMASMTKQNADNASQAKNLSGEADHNAKTGADAMNRMSSAINKIKESSDQTAKIVKTIDEIAMQTNLLALNAAVEAARAGEAGRGFAVVAEEVRNLAQRSAQAAKNTADMISESVKNADDGVKIATEVSEAFGSIAVSSKKVNDLIAEIAAASQEQSQGIDQVNTAVAQMDKVTQQNAANSEESASAAEELSSQSEELKTMIDQFNLTMTNSSHRSYSAARVEPKRHDMTTDKQVQMADSRGQSKKSIKKTSGKKDDFLPMDDDVLKEF
jgi:methyl-accepting chemotaxis protein